MAEWQAASWRPHHVRSARCACCRTLLPYSPSEKQTFTRVWHSSIPSQQIWGRLTRQLKPDVSQNTQLYTMLPVPNPFVVPGARFREV